MTSTVPSMMVATDRLTGADIQVGQYWRRDTCDPPEREYEYEITDIQDERVFLRPLNGGRMSETFIGSLLAYWVPIKL
jgi:hypothetical protein